jgi:uncharacterized protein YdiU (UPF0061 family)
MDEYDPSTVFSSIDRRGRYAYGRQPAIAQWNLARFAEVLVPLIHEDTDEAVRLATQIVAPVVDVFDGHYLEGMRLKVGLATPEDGDTELIKPLLEAMRAGKVDFTLAFRRLADVAAGDPGTRFRDLFPPDSMIDDWLPGYRERLGRETAISPAARASAMLAVNPVYIPRNHRVEAALDAATARGDFAPFERLLALLQKPFEERPDAAGFELPPAPGERVMATFCGT